jgi:Xaa-Pro dipeptidase
MEPSQRPKLSLSERDRRWARIREEMEREGLDCLIIIGKSGMWDSHSANVRYVTQIFWESMAVFPLKGEPTGYIWGAHHIEWYREFQDWVRDIRSGRWQWAEAAGGRVKELGYGKGRIGLVGLGGWSEPEGIWPHQLYIDLSSQLREAELVNATGMIEKIRLVKSPEEIGMLQRAAEMGDEAVQALIRSAAAGKNECEVFADVVRSMLAQGSEFPPMLIWESGPRPLHARYYPGLRVLQKGDLIINEISPRWCGYWGHPHQPVSIGAPSDPEFLEMFAVVYASFEEGRRSLVPGSTIEEVDRAFGAPIEEAGYIWIHPCIHGIGLQVTESPRTSVAGTSPPLPGGLRMEEGMVFAVEPIVAAKDRTKAIPLGDTVVVTPSGGRRLGRRKLELVRV